MKVILETNVRNFFLFQVKMANSYPQNSKERETAVLNFSLSFVPEDVSEDDIQHFSGNLLNDSVSSY